MSRSVRTKVKSTLAFIGVLGLLGLGWIGMTNVLLADAFAKFRTTGQPMGFDVGVTLKDFELKSYESGKLTLQAHVGQMEVRRDRSQMHMKHVTAGRLVTSEGEYALDGDDAVYHYFLKRLATDGRSHIKNEDIDLTARRFVYDKETNALEVRGQVTGTLGGGGCRG